LWTLIKEKRKERKNKKNFDDNVKNDYVRLLLTKTFQKNVQKNRKEILMDNVLTNKD
jgi:hypothetical protein